MSNRPDLPQGLPMEELMKLANSPQGQSILSQLQNQHSKELDAALIQAQAGDFARVKRSVTDFLHSPAGQEIMKQLRGKQDG